MISSVIKKVVTKIEDELPESYYDIAKSLKFGPNTIWAYASVMLATSAAFGTFLWYFSTLTVTETIVSNTLLDGYDCSILSPLSGISYFSATTSENGQYRSAKLTSEQCIEHLTSMKVCENTYDHINVLGEAGGQIYREFDDHLLIYIDTVFDTGESAYARYSLYGESVSFPRPSMDVVSLGAGVINGTSILSNTDPTSIASFIDEYDGKYYSLDSTGASLACINCDDTVVYELSSSLISYGLASYTIGLYGEPSYLLIYNKKLYGIKGNIIEYDLETEALTTWSHESFVLQGASDDDDASRNNCAGYYTTLVDHADENNLKFYMAAYIVRSELTCTKSNSSTFYELDLQSRTVAWFNLTAIPTDSYYFGEAYTFFGFIAGQNAAMKGFIFNDAAYSFNGNDVIKLLPDYATEVSAIRNYSSSEPDKSFMVPGTDLIYYVYSDPDNYMYVDIYDISNNSSESMSVTEDTAEYFPHMYMIAYTYGVCDNEITKYLVEVSATLDYSIVCTSGMGYYYQSPNEYYAIPPDCLNQQTLTNYSSFLSCPEIKSKLDELKASTCEASIEKICVASYDDNPPFSCTRQVGLNTFSILGQASSNASICYTIASLFVMIFMNRCRNKKEKKVSNSIELTDVDNKHLQSNFGVVTDVAHAT